MQPLVRNEPQRPGPHQDEQSLQSPEIWTLAAAIVLIAFYFATSLYISAHRLLWVDEIATAVVTRLPGGLATIWRAAAQGVAPLPPTYFMMVRLFDDFLGHSDFAMRLPSALAMMAGLLLTFDCARRLTDGLHGLIALSVLTCSLLPYYGHEARSYSLYFMFASLSLWIWVRDENDSRRAAVSFGIVFLLAVAMHYYAILCLVPYLIWELWNWRPWRLPSRKIMGALLGVACAAAFLWASIQAGRRLYPPHYWSRPSLEILRTILDGLFPDGLFLIALIVLWIAWAGSRDRAIPLLLLPMKSGERVGWFFLFIPLAGYILAQMAHAFQLRYVIGALPGVAVAFSCWLWRNLWSLRRASLGVFLILATWGAAKQAIATRDPNRFYYSPVRQMLSMEDVLHNDGKRYFVVCNQARYGEATYYSKHPDDYALLLLPSVQGYWTHELKTVAQYHPMQIWTLEDLKQHARETALLMPVESNLDSLQQAGIRATMHFTKPIAIYYLE